MRLTPVYPSDFPAILALAYRNSGKHAEAIDAARASLELKRDNLDPHLIMAASYVALGHAEEGRLVAEHALQIKPEFSLSDYGESHPYKNQSDLDLLLERLGAAGLSK